MKYIIIALVILTARASLELSSFNVKSHTTAIHQINSTMVVTGSEGGWIRLYAIKNGQILREQYYHKAKIISIQSYASEDERYIITADESGLVCIWNEHIELYKQVDTKSSIESILLSNQSELIINTGSQILFYDITNLSFAKSVKVKGKIIKHKLVDSKHLSYLQQHEGATSIYLCNKQNNELKQVMRRQEKIHDYAIEQFNSTYLLYVIDSLSHLIIYQLNDHLLVTKHAKQQQNLMFPSNYTSILYFKNEEKLPIFATVRQNGKIEYLVAFKVLMFLQFNYQVRLIISNILNSLVFLDSNDRITVVTMKDTDDSNHIWIILLILLLLAISLYLCLSDCCPGVYSKWKEQKQRKSIEMALYKQKSSLDNF